MFTRNPPSSQTLNNSISPSYLRLMKGLLRSTATVFLSSLPLSHNSLTKPPMSHVEKRRQIVMLSSVLLLSFQNDDP